MRFRGGMGGMTRWGMELYSEEVIEAWRKVRED